MARLTTAAIITLLLAAAGTANASSAVAVASARIVRATMVSTGPLVSQLAVSSTDLQRGYISLQNASIRSNNDTTAFSVRVEIPSVSGNMTLSGQASTNGRIAVAGTEASLRQNPFAYVTYDGQ